MTRGSTSSTGQFGNAARAVTRRSASAAVMQSVRGQLDDGAPEGTWGGAESSAVALSEPEAAEVGSEPEEDAGAAPCDLALRGSPAAALESSAASEAAP